MSVVLSVEEVLDLLASAGVAELSEGFCLDLAYTLTGNVKALAYLLKCTGLAVLKTETELEHLCLTVCKCGKYLVELLLQKCM